VHDPRDRGPVAGAGCTTYIISCVYCAADKHFCRLQPDELAKPIL